MTERHLLALEEAVSILEEVRGSVGTVSLEEAVKAERLADEAFCIALRVRSRAARKVREETP